MRIHSFRRWFGIALASSSFACAGPRAATEGSASAPAPGEQPAVSLEVAQAALAKDPENVELLFQTGLAWQARADSNSGALATADRDSALAVFDAVLARDPVHVKALVHSGLVLEDLGKTDDALARYTKATEAAPNDPRPYVNLGSLLYFHSKRIYDAKVALTHALELDPSNADARFNLGVLFADATLFREARTEWEKVAAGPDGPAKELAKQNLEKIGPLLAAQDSAMAAARENTTPAAAETTQVAPPAADGEAH